MALVAGKAVINVFPSMQGFKSAVENEINSVGATADKVSGGIGSKFKSGFGTAATAAVAVGAAATAAAGAAGAGMVNLAKKTAEAGDAIEKNSQKVGLSYKAYQQWDYVMQISGTSMQDATVGLKTLTNKFDDAMNGSKSAQETFSRLGISLEELQGKSREEIFATTVTALQGVESEMDKAALASDLFGKSGQNLMPMFNMTAEETQKLIGDTERLGLVMSDDAVSASAAFQDSLTSLQGAFSGVKNRIGAELLPSMTSIMDGFSSLIAGEEGAAGKIVDGFANLGGGIASAVPNILASVGKIGGEIVSRIVDSLSAAFPEVGAVFDDLKAMFGNIGKSAKKIDLGKVFSAVKAAVGAVLPVIGNLVRIFISVATVVKNTITAMWPLITLVGSTLVGVFKTVWGVISTFISIVAKIASTFASVNTTVMGLLGSLQAKFTSAFAAIRNAVSTAISAIVSFFSGLGGRIIGAVTGALASVVAIFSGLGSRIIGVLAGAGSWLLGIGASIVGGLRNGISGAIGTVTSALAGIGGRIKSALAGAGSWLMSTGRSIIEGLISGIKSRIGSVASTITSGISGAVGKLRSFLDINSPSKLLAREVGSPIAEGIAYGVARQAPAMMNSIEGSLAGIDKLAYSVPVNLTGSKLTAQASNLNTAGGAATAGRIVNQTINVQATDPASVAAVIAARERIALGA